MRQEFWAPILFLIASAAVLAAAAALSDRAETTPRPHAAHQVEPVRIAVAADLHYLSPALTDGGAYFTDLITNADGKLMQYSDAITEAFTETIIREQPDVLVIAGDLTFNGARQSHTDLIEKLRRIEDAGVRVLVLPGNHDLNSVMAASFHGDGFTRVESVKADDFAALYGQFGYNEALSRDSASLSYVSTVSPGLRLLLIDTNTPESPGAVKRQTLQWAEEQLKAADEAGARVICVTHQTVLQHNSAFSNGFVIVNRAELSALLQRHGVPCSLCGHMHIQHTETLGALTEISVSALCVAPCQFGMLDIDAAGGVFRTETVDVAAWAAQTGSRDPALLDFAQAADAFSADNSRRQGKAAASAAPECEAMVQYLIDLNRAYFSGRMDTVSPDARLLALWEENDPFIAAYLRSITEDTGADFTEVKFSFA